MKSINEILRSAVQEVADTYCVRIDRVSVDWIGTGDYRDYRVFVGEIRIDGPVMPMPSDGLQDDGK